jgi:cell filamentation protein
VRPVDRYDVSALAEAQSEPGSRGRVLRNLLGVTRKRRMDWIEAQAQLRALEHLLSEFGAGHQFAANDVRHIHRTWLSGIYEWAGEYRRVNLSKGHLPFAVAGQISRLMGEFEKGVLRPNTPCFGMGAARLAAALAVVHAELILIHPFRDGNGRAARLLAILMAAQAGFPPLNFSGVKGTRRLEYFAAVHAALDRDYAPMESFFAAVIRRTCRAAGAEGLPCPGAPTRRGRAVADGPPRSPSTTPRRQKATGRGGRDR